MRKAYGGLLLIVLLGFYLFSHGKDAVADEKDIYIATPLATQETLELFDFLKEQRTHDKILFGQQHATDEGLTLTGEAPRAGSMESEVKNAVGDYPAVFGWDTLSLDGYEKPGVYGNKEQSIENTALSMKTAHELGGIIVLSMHPHNFVTGGDFNDTTGDVVKNILPGGKANEAFNEWLDNIAYLANLLVDDEGKEIPFIFRPFHEQNGGWFWWGESVTSPEQYVAAFRYTVEYLRDTKHINNILYAYTPGSMTPGDKNQYLKTYPGDDYVDIFGIDNYDDRSNPGSETWINALVSDLEMIVSLAEERGKIAALTEYGYGLKENGNPLDWYTKVFNKIQKSEQARKISYMFTWANFGWPDNMFVPYRDIHGDLGGDHELLSDFIDFYEDERTQFVGDVKGQIYEKGKVYKTQPLQSNMYALSPTSGNFVGESEVAFIVRVTNDPDAKVTMMIESGNQLQTLEKVGQNYTGTLQIPAQLNGQGFNVILNYYSQEELKKTETIRLFAQIPEVQLCTLSFVDDITSIQSKGAYPEGEQSPQLSLSKLGDETYLKTSFSPFSNTETWQEVKYQLLNVHHDILGQMNRVQITSYFPSHLKGYVKAIGQWDGDDQTKYGEDQTRISVDDLNFVEIEGEKYYEAIFTFQMPLNTAVDNFSFSVVGEHLSGWDHLLISSIKLYNSYIIDNNPLLIDNFESYFGEQSLLDRAYGSNGDPVMLSLSQSLKNSGNYGLKYSFSLGEKGYAGRSIAFDRDWKKANAMSLWLSNEGNIGNHLTIQIKVGEVSFEYDYDLTNPYEGILTVPFEKFKPASWEEDQGAIITEKGLASVSQLALYTGGTKQSGVFYIDDIQAVFIQE